MAFLVKQFYVVGQITHNPEIKCHSISLILKPSIGIDIGTLIVKFALPTECVPFVPNQRSSSF